MIIPCIDLMSGKAVQLIRGKEKALEIEDPWEMVEQFKSFPLIHVIDLDAAKGKGDNLQIMKEICSKICARAGGGIRSLEYAQILIQSGAHQVIIGTKAFSNQGINEVFLDDLSRTIGREKVIISLDSRNDKIVIKGWTESIDISSDKVIAQLEPYCAGFLCTYVDQEGTMEGTNLEWFHKLRSWTSLPVIAAGGIGSYEEVETLCKISVDVALGMSIYTGRLDVKKLLVLNQMSEK